MGVAVSSFAFIASSQRGPLPYPEGGLEPLFVSYYTDEPHSQREITDIPGFMAAMWIFERLQQHSQMKDELTVKDDLMFALSSRLALLRHSGVGGSFSGNTKGLRMFAELESRQLKNSPFGRESSDLSLMSEDAKTAWVADGIAYFLSSEGMEEPPQASKLEACIEYSMDRGQFEKPPFMTSLNDMERVIMIEMYKEARKAYQKPEVREEMEGMGLPVALAQGMKLTDAMMDVYRRLSKEDFLNRIGHEDDIVD